MAARSCDLVERRELSGQQLKLPRHALLDLLLTMLECCVFLFSPYSAFWPVRMGLEEQPGPASGRGGADVPRERARQGGAGGAPPTGLWGAGLVLQLVREAGLCSPAAGLHAGAA